MRLTTKGRYAVMAMLDLALHREQERIPLAEIARRQGISALYLEQLFAKLRRKGLVRGVRGPGGGYRLGHPAAETTIAEIIGAVDEHVDVTRCAGEENCQGGEQCVAHELWSDLNDRIQAFFSGISLEDLTTDVRLLPALSGEEAENNQREEIQCRKIKTKPHATGDAARPARAASDH
uniref:Transcriptional regulator, BadM/Rrf2 family n=1 Tax=Candidatus Kentrum sp. DK TaxID=2126562 RepID=A0A450SK74_9GAMM|nr:MAG: transcriptional regulator, BadM/Rrf2 family [Candidatus Kentron sp. DK]VFJ53920.1 MAG: transcriptional regulator, BadM/Rrf2 family [Candidatus Kentron sp. DK]